MKNDSGNKVRLGLFVLIATVFLILGLYFIGSKKNIFHSSIRISTSFSNVGGLMQGNNVRFNGINVGTVSSVYAIADTAIKVEFTIDKNIIQFIDENAIASVGTDGLLGNKLINISPGDRKGKPLEEGDKLASVNPIIMDDELRTITGTNSNLKLITDNLRGISEKLNADNSLWRLLADSVLGENVRSAVVRFRITGENTAVASGDLRNILKDIKSGKGSLGSLIVDTTFSHQLTQSIVNIKTISDTMVLISGDLRNVSGKLRSGNGAIGTLLTDTAFVGNLNKSMVNIKDASGNFNENMEALKVSWPFKKYFKKKKKSKSKQP
jgi:phospholipid/cholesterol/gamma-HCH transport system substrate-binding protein